MRTLTFLGRAGFIVLVQTVSGAWAAPPTPPSAPMTDHLAQAIQISDGPISLTRTRRELGFREKMGPSGVSFVVDLAPLKAALERITPAFHRDAVNPRPVFYGGHFTVQPGRDAVALNVSATAQGIADAVTKDPTTTHVKAVLEKHGPERGAGQYAGIDGLLASFSTKTSANPKRNHNVALAAEKINGTILAPDQIFSLNARVGMRTHATGFLTAPVFVNAELVPGIGGGVSQITGTLFNAAAHAGLQIVEVHPHSRPVAYLPVGYDATVAYGDEDLRFKNNTGAPLYIDYQFDPKTRHLTAMILGKKQPGRAIQLHANVKRLAPGKIDAELYRVIRVNGVVKAKERLFTHHYRWDPTKKE